MIRLGKVVSIIEIVRLRQRDIILNTVTRYDSRVFNGEVI